MRSAALLLAAACAVAVLAGCGDGSSPRASGGTSTGSVDVPTGSANPGPSASAGSASASPSASHSPTPTSTTSTPTTSAPTPTEKPDPRWRFYTRDRHRYTSPWFAGSHRIMIGFGCTAAPYYSPDPACPGNEGSHHGIDVAMPCGTPLTSAVTGTVLHPSAPGTPGPAYGVNPFRIRVSGPGGEHDILIGHTRRVFVHPGERVHPGQRIALSSDSGAPDGCHLHFEVRPAGGDYTDAVDPSRWLRLTPLS
ncbi:M23 family metallopeptidase [Nocardioides sp. KR10-350]|uniref:M23 family metallopeptidase n=1 Tax=Nocardioides cheoyonin TaxID=3156615 RepID=UPI0032B4A899